MYGISRLGERRVIQQFEPIKNTLVVNSQAQSSVFSFFLLFSKPI